MTLEMPMFTVFPKKYEFACSLVINLVIYLGINLVIYLESMTKYITELIVGISTRSWVCSWSFGCHWWKSGEQSYCIEFVSTDDGNPGDDRAVNDVKNLYQVTEEM